MSCEVGGLPRKTLTTQQPQALPALTDLYEAFVLWSFYKCMVESFGPREDLILLLERKKESFMLMPFCCMRQRLSFVWLQRSTLGVVQYVFVRSALSIGVFVLAVTGMCSWQWYGLAPSYGC